MEPFAGGVTFVNCTLFVGIEWKEILLAILKPGQLYQLWIPNSINQLIEEETPGLEVSTSNRINNNAHFGMKDALEQSY